MNSYSCFKHPSGALDVVKQGWSWPAFFFTWLWAFSKGLNAIGAVACICFVILGIMRAGSPFEAAFALLLMLGVSLWLGAQGNELFAKELLKKGYTLEKTLLSKSAMVEWEGSVDPSHNLECFCTDCGVSVGEDAKFCASCGVDFRTQGNGEGRAPRVS